MSAPDTAGNLGVDSNLHARCAHAVSAHHLSMLPASLLNIRHDKQLLQQGCE